MKKHNPTAVPRTLDEIAVSGARAETPRTSARRPNIVLWMMDDVGVGNLSPYGGLVDMPAMQRIADRGFLFTSFHVTPLCAPTRACVLTGRNHHTNHMGSLPRFVSAGAGTQDGKIPRENGFLPEMLLEEGYATMCLGKWHLTTLPELNFAASRKAWPLGRGFERFYGFLAGQSSQFSPHLVQDNGPLHPPRVEGPGYHLSEDLVGTGIRYVRELRSGDRDKPFFMYLSFGAGHSPHHVPREWMERYRGRFDAGWDEYRQVVHRRQQELGIVPKDSPLSGRDPDVPPWSEQSEEQRTVYARFMEAFAGMCSHMDHEVGRLMDELEALGELDDTIFLVMSDNGASSEGGPEGAYNNLQFHGQLEQVSASLANIDRIGTPEAYNHYPWGWAWAGNTPFRRWKRETYRGGCAVPFVVSYPARLPEGHGTRAGFAHAIDVVPTLLDLLAVEPPRALAGVAQAPIEGTSVLAHILDRGVPSGHDVQYYEMMGHRAIHADGWRAVCPWPAPSAKEAGPAQPGKDHRFKDLHARDLDRLEESGWELYRITDDPAESRNLAAEEPRRLQAMISRWWYEAGRFGVLPLMGAPPGKAQAKPSLGVFFPGMAPVFIEAAPSVTGTDFTISAQIAAGSQPAHGMLLAHGGKFGGYALGVFDGKPRFIYNYFGLSETSVSSPSALLPGNHVVRADFRRTGPPAPERGRGAPGVLTLSVDGRKVAHGEIVDTAAGMLSFTGTLTCGYHHAEAFNADYVAPFAYNGRIFRVVVATGGATIDEALEQRDYMRRQ